MIWLEAIDIQLIEEQPAHLELDMGWFYLEQLIDLLVLTSPELDM